MARKEKRKINWVGWIYVMIIILGGLVLLDKVLNSESLNEKQENEIIILRGHLNDLNYSMNYVDQKHTDIEMLLWMGTLSLSAYENIKSMHETGIFGCMSFKDAIFMSRMTPDEIAFPAQVMIVIYDKGVLAHYKDGTIKCYRRLYKTKIYAGEFPMLEETQCKELCT